MSQPPATPPRLRVSDLPQTQPIPFVFEPDSETLAHLTDVLDLSALRKVRLQGTIRAQGKRDWRIDARLGATVVQPCVASLEPVTTRLDAPVMRLFVADYEAPEATDVEMPDDDTIEPLGSHIDLSAILEEALALNLPVYPRKEALSPVEISVTEPGKTPLSDDDVKPFARLAALRDKLDGTE